MSCKSVIMGDNGAEIAHKECAVQTAQSCARSMRTVISRAVFARGAAMAGMPALRMHSAQGAACAAPRAGISFTTRSFSLAAATATRLVVHV